MKYLIALIVLFMPVPVYAEAFYEQLQQPDVFRSHYQEQKYLPSFSKPLTSEGDFIFIKGRGLAWLMNKPFDMDTVITADGISKWVEGEKQEQPEEIQKILRPVLNNISAIFYGDVTALEKTFTITELPSEQGEWQVSLTPRSEHMKPYLQEIRIGGDTSIKRIEVINAPGKYTVTTYGTPQAGTNVVTPEEEALFAQ